jgi:MFS family permease
VKGERCEWAGEENMRRRKGARSKKEADGSTARVARSLTNEEMDDISSGCESDLNDGRGIVVPIWDNSLGEGLQKHPREWLTAALAPRNLATLIYALSYTVSLPILPFMARKFLYEDDLSLRGLSEAWRGPMYGVVMSAYYLTKMVAAPLLGFLSDRIGRRLSLLLTLWGSAATFLLTFAVGQHSLEGLILCRMLMGCFGANGALMMAYVRDTVPREQQASAFAQHSAAWGLAYAMAGPLLTAVKEDIGTSLCLAASFMALAACVVGIFFVETVSPNGKPTAQKDADSAITKSATGSAAVVEWVEKGSKVEANGHIRARKKSFKELESDGKEAGGSITPKRGKRGWKRAQLRAMVRVFQLMLSERMVLGLFALQVLRPAQDLAPLINSKFGGGASVVALLSSIRAAIRVFLPMSPLMPMLSSCFSCKGRSQEQVCFFLVV